ncbi:hypothetical protein ACLOAV_003862 [Pseudogymnoascus australis]
MDSKPQEPAPSGLEERNSIQLQRFDFSTPTDDEPSKNREYASSLSRAMQNWDHAQLSRPHSLMPRQYRSSGHGANRPVSHRSSAPSPTNSSDGDSPSMIAKYISERAILLRWFEAPDEKSFAHGSPTCVAVKVADTEHVFEPADVNPALANAIRRLDECVVLAMSSQITASVIVLLTPQQKSLAVDETGARLPIIASLEDVGSALVHATRACIVRKERIVLIWSDDPGAIMTVGNAVEKQLLGLLFNSRQLSNVTTPRMSARSSLRHQSYSDVSKMPMSTTTEITVRGALDEKNEVYIKAVALEEGTGEDDDGDLEAELPVRPTARVHSIKVSLAIMLVILTQILGVSKLLNEYTWDGGYWRFALVVTIPPLAMFSLFFFIILVNSVFQLLLPLGNCLKNTKYHSAIKPKLSRHRNYELPHITIQMPVYKEGLKGVIVPTIISLMAAIQHYEEQGGTASVFVNDDGMQVVEQEVAKARSQYYREHGIGYTARLPNRKLGPKKGGSWFRKSKSATEDIVEDNDASTPQEISNKIGFERKGKFKKASNMNYGLAFSNRVEDELHRLTQLEVAKRGINAEDLTVGNEDELYEQALHNMLVADEGRTWAEGNIRIGELILIVDCDTRVPVDCLLYGALEMHESPEVAILQHGSGVMQVVHNMFENGITFFTNIVYTSIKYGVGTGDVAPFVGHNAFLRWKALQSIEYVDPSDGQTKWWSDAHVSEDFDISLRLQMHGMLVRLATYHHGGFKEGVSLTVYDEVTRWEKYAYGCNELVFNPFYQWIYKGPVTRLFLRFLWSNIPVTSKVTILAYIFTYYALASGMLLTAINYIIIGLFPDDIDHLYLPSWGIWVSLVVVFNGFASVAFSMLRHQMKEETFWKALLHAIKWLPFLILFFGGISLNCAKALLCHAFSINIEWASTAKEMGPTGFYIGLDKMVQSFKYTWLVCLVLSGVMIYFAVGAPWGWTIAPGPHSTATIAIIPLAIQICSAFFLPLGLGLN